MAVIIHGAGGGGAAFDGELTGENTKLIIESTIDEGTDWSGFNIFNAGDTPVDLGGGSTRTGFELARNHDWNDVTMNHANRTAFFLNWDAGTDIAFLSNGAQLLSGGPNPCILLHSNGGVMMGQAAVANVMPTGGGAISSDLEAKGKLDVDGDITLRTMSDPSATSGHAKMFCSGSGTSTEMKVIDGAGNITTISPHNDEGDWEYYSYNKRTGKSVRVNMEKMIRKLEEFTGETFIETD